MKIQIEAILVKPLPSPSDHPSRVVQLSLSDTGTSLLSLGDIRLELNGDEYLIKAHEIVNAVRALQPQVFSRIINP